jgi:hypothetical protein
MRFGFGGLLGRNFFDVVLGWDFEKMALNVVFGWTRGGGLRGKRGLWMFVFCAG